MTTPRDAIAGRETHIVHDPFLKRDVEVSSKLTDRLRGKYASGPTMPNGEPEFGWRQFETPPIQHEAADAIDSLLKERDALQARVWKLEAEKTIGWVETINNESDQIARMWQDRATRLQQERDEAYERAAAVVESGDIPVTYGVNAVRAEMASRIRRLAGPEKIAAANDGEERR
jgi:hypothetical protein